METVILKMSLSIYISSFAIWVICYAFYGKSEVGLLTRTTLKQMSLFQDKQKKALEP